MSDNPYAPPTAPSAVNPGQSTSESIRKLHLKHEASVKSIGTLYFIGGFFLIVASVATLFVERGPSNLPVSGGLVLLGALQIWLAISIRKLKKGAKIPAIILSVIGLIGFPVGTLLSAYFLYLLCSKKGTMVFSDEYARVIAETPHIKYRTSVVVWILLAILILLVITILFFAAA